MGKTFSCQIKKYKLEFKTPVKTSRDTLTNRKIWIIKIADQLGRDGIGEIAPIIGLSIEFDDSFKDKMKEVCDNINYYLDNKNELRDYSSILFGIETAWMNYKNRNFIFHDNDFTRGYKKIPINALVWMGDYEYMKSQIDEILPKNPKCIKLKIGGIDIDKELKLVEYIRSQKSSEELNIRLDANGAFAPGKAIDLIKKFSKYQIHSIEQPIKSGQHEDMFRICNQSPIPVALDEELIGVTSFKEKKMLIEKINPKFLVLKPSLHGGFSGVKEWIFMAKTHGIKYWVTSSLESNIGLNAIAQWVSTYEESYDISQGLGTSKLFKNNFPSKLTIKNYMLGFGKLKEYN